jgi:hypothetical protein
MIHAEFKTQLQILARDIKKDETKLLENFLYNFAWVGEDLWKMKYKQHFIQYAFNAALEREDLNEDIEHALKAEIKPRLEMLRSECLRSYNVRENSTGALHRETSLWKFQCQLELIEWLNRLVK